MASGTCERRAGEPGAAIWIPKVEARRKLGIGQKAFEKLLAAGELTVKQLPGSVPRVRADELDGLIARYTRPARAGN